MQCKPHPQCCALYKALELPCLNNDRNLNVRHNHREVTRDHPHQAGWRRSARVQGPAGGMRQKKSPRLSIQPKTVDTGRLTSIRVSCYSECSFLSYYVISSTPPPLPPLPISSTPPPSVSYHLPPPPCLSLIPPLPLFLSG
jgi:hypothetical protein